MFTFVTEAIHRRALPTMGWNQRKRIFPYLLMLPTFLVFFVVIFYPLGYGISLAFTNKSLISRSFSFVGLEQFHKLVGDPIVLEAIKNSILFTVYSVAGIIIVGFLLAYLLNLGLKPQGLYRGLLLIPWTVCTLVAAILWSWLFNPMYGWLDYILVCLGLPKILFLANPNLSLLSVSLVMIWRNFPFAMIVFLAGLQSMDRELFEAAAVDGATGWQRFINLTIPLITPLAKILILLELIWTFNHFDTVWILTKGGPGNATQLLTTYTYYNAFLKFNMGYGSAIAIIILIILVILSSVYIRSIAFAGED